MAVLDPLKVIIYNYPDGDGEQLFAPWHPKQPEIGSRALPFSRELFIEREDFAEVPPPGFKRLIPGGDIRLRFAYVLRCDSVEKDVHGAISALHCSYYPDSKSGQDVSGRKPGAAVHWVDARRAVPVEVRLYDVLFTQRVPDSEHLDDALNPDSLQTITAWLEPAMAALAAGARYQFERQGYFIADSRDSYPDKPVFNRTVTLRDSWKPPR